MIHESFLSRFTPSLLRHETLEATFVQREELAARIVARIDESVRTANKHYMLFVGPRGIGKTHLVSLVFHRVRAAHPNQHQLLIAWLREEEWQVASFLDLLIAILRALDEAYPDLQPAAAREKLFSMPPDDAQRLAEQLLIDTVDHRTLLVLIENLDEVFHGLEESGQQQFRAFIQNHPFLTLVATSQSLFDGVSLRESPFYGFFDIEHLREFSFEEAVEMLALVAEQSADENKGAELSRKIRSGLGRARIRAVHHLAAGNPRVYMIFSQFLTVDSLIDLVEPILKTLDDLTPYYQARMSYLSPQQRKIVVFLCEHRGAVTVREIAERSFISQQAAAIQLKRLKELGYVRSEPLGRESYYELREPLMRISLEVKKQRGEPLRLFIEFLRLWYSPTELNQHLQALPKDAKAREYFARALQTEEAGDTVSPAAACQRDYDHAWKRKQYEDAIRALDDLISYRTNPWDRISKAKCLRMLERDSEAVGILDELAKSDGEIASPNNQTWLWLSIAMEYRELQQADRALQLEDRALAVSPDSPSVWNNRGVSLRNLGQEAEAIVSFERAASYRPENAEEWQAVGIACGNLERCGDAVEAFLQSIRLHRDDPSAWERLGLAYWRMNEYEKADDAFREAARLDPTDIAILHRRTELLEKIGRFEEALELQQAIVRIDDMDPWQWNWLAVHQYECGRMQDSLESLQRALALSPNEPNIMSNLGIALASVGRLEQALATFDRLLVSFVDAADFQVRSNRATILFHLDRWDEGRAAFDSLLSEFSKSSEKDDGAEIAIVRNLLLRTRDITIWRRIISEWVTLFERHRLLASLGQGIIRSIRSLQISWMTADDALRWNGIWQELGKKHADLSIPLRLLNAAAQFRKKPDRRILLQLPAEEREILSVLIAQNRSASVTSSS